MNTKIKGELGEDIACIFLKSKGFGLVMRNYRKKWGEIDIIAEKEGGIHFFEVKSVTNPFFVGYRPEDNVHKFKSRHISRMIETYMAENNRGMDEDFSFHVLCVFMDMKKRKARV